MIKKLNFKRRTIIIDSILLVLLLGIHITSFFMLYTFGILPKKWLHMGVAFASITFFIFLVLSLNKLPLWGLILKRIAIVTIALVVGYAGFISNKSKTTIENISTAKKEETPNKPAVTKTDMFIITSKNAPISSLADLSGKTIGFQNGSDKGNLEFIKTSLQKDLPNYVAKDMMDYTTLLNELNYGRIQAIAISQHFYNMTKLNINTFENSVKTIKTYTKETTVDTKTELDITNDVFTIYVSGLDNTGSPDQQTRTDTNLILIVNPKARHITMASLPRDGYIPNTALNNENDKLTHTGMYGIDTSVQSIQKFINIPIDFYARVSFNSMIEIVDTIGGIYVDVELDFCEQDEHRSFAKDDLICLVKGEQKLNGKQALAYSRHRKTFGYDNAGRERAQQKIIKAIVNKLISPSAFSYVNQLLDIAPNYIITDMQPNQITKFVSKELESMKSWTISNIISDTGVYDNQVVASLSLDGPKDVYLFNKNEMHAIVNAYDGAVNQMKMNTFSFNLDNLYAKTPKITQDPTIVWDTMAVNPH